MRGAGAGNERGNFHNDCDGDDNYCHGDDDKDENEYKEGGDDDGESSDRDGDVNPIRSISLSLQKKCSCITVWVYRDDIVHPVVRHIFA